MKINQALLRKYQEGTCTPAELAALKAYFEQNQLDDLQQILREDWKNLDPSSALAPEHSARLWNRLNEAIPVATEPRVWRLNVNAWRRIAAVGLVVVIALSALWINRLLTAASWEVVHNSAADANRRLALADGSVVWLAPGSTLRFRKGLSGKMRALELQGEAFFKVKKDLNRPFSVLAAGIRTTALGTSFRIKAKEDSPEIQVALVTGRVVIQPEGIVLQKSSYFLTPGRQLVLAKGSAVPKMESIDNQLVLDWRDGKLVFENTALKFVLQKLKSLYGVDIDFQSKAIQDCVVNTSFPKNEPIKNILTVLAFANSLEVTQSKKNHFKLSGLGCLD